MRHLLFSAFASVVLPALAVGCGAIAEEDPKAPPVADVTQPLACARPRTAPLLSIANVDRSIVGPCGDVAYRLNTGAVFLRTSDGVTTQLASEGQVGEFDAAGTALSFSRAGKEGVVRDLATGEETATAATASFGLDPATGKAIPFFCGDDGVHVVTGHTVSAAVPGTSSYECREHARFGATVSVVGKSAGLGFVDLAHQQLTVADVDYRNESGSPTADGAWRQDAVRLSADGRVAVFQATSFTWCGDTTCPSATGIDIVDTRTGRVTAHADGGRLTASGAAGTIRESGTTLFDPNTKYAVDTATGTLADYRDTTFLQLQDDGLLVLARPNGPGNDILLARPGEAAATAWFSTSRPGSVAAWPDRKRALVLEIDRSIKVTGDASTWGGSEYGDLVLRDEDHEVARHPFFTSITPLAFPSDGSIVFSAGHYAGQPPADAVELSDTSLAIGYFRIGADGALTPLSVKPDGADVSMFPVQDGAFVSVARSWDGMTSHTVVAALDPATGAARPLFESAGSVYPASTPWRAPLGLLALEQHDDTGGATLWHGIP